MPSVKKTDKVDNSSQPRQQLEMLEAQTEDSPQAKQAEAALTYPDSPAMTLDVLGRLEKIRLGREKAVYPLFEAFINSIHAIQDAEIPCGRITITVFRDSTQADHEGVYPIKDIRIEDNGIGFTDDNYGSFLKSDSLYKKDRGGKGIGRFVWLRVFSSVEISSIFAMNGTFMRRAFRFRASQQPIADYVFERILDGQQGTTVLLKGVEPYFSQGIPLKLETLADRIIEHFMEFFSTTKDWLIVLKDDTDDENVIDLFRRHSDIYEAAASVEPVKVGTIDFSIRHMRKKRAEGSKHSMTLCGGGREVTRVNLVKYLPELTSKIQDDSGAYYYHGLVSGRYLDERLNEARTAFEVPDQEDMATAEEPAIRQIIKQCIGVIERHLSAELDILREANLRAVEQHIDKSAPYYRFLKHYARDELGRIPASLDGREKDMRLYMIKTDLEAKARRETDSILRQIQEEPEYFKDHVAEFEQRVGLINDINKSDLARYIVKRKMILEILKQVISRRKDGTFCLEKAVHELVFPLRHTSDDVPYEKHNLWVIDERLAFHNYLSSDLPLSNTPGIDCDSREEPDIIVFDYPVSLAEGTPPFKSISIIEFKKPMKTTFSEKDNPLRQVMRYIRKIQSRSNDPVSGRPYHVTDAVRFYCYVICEISQDIIDTARELTLAQLPDGEGYIGYNPYYRAYFDVFSFERLLGDAEKRNEMMFEKLGL